MTPDDFPLTPEEDRGIWACAWLFVILAAAVFSYLWSLL